VETAAVEQQVGRAGLMGKRVTLARTSVTSDGGPGSGECCR
jgi:hypothetical protein